MAWTHGPGRSRWHHPLSAFASFRSMSERTAWEPPSQEDAVSSSSGDSGPDLPLFRKPFVTDWTVVLGLLAVGASTTQQLRGYPSLIDSPDSYNLIAAAVDVAVAFLFQLLVWAFLPAWIRRRIRLRRLRKGKSLRKDFREFRVFKVWLLALGVLLVVAGSTEMFKSGNPDFQGPLSGSSPSNVSIPKECFPRGEDEVCISGFATGNLAILQFTWTYRSDPQVEDSLGRLKTIHQWTWSASVNCDTRTGGIMSLSALGPSGDDVRLDEVIVSQIQEGMYNDYIVPLLQEC